MAITITNASTTAATTLKQYQQEFAQENGWVARSGIPSISTRYVVKAGPAGTFASVRGSSYALVDVTFDGGATWNAQTMPLTVSYTGLAYGGSAFVAVGGNSTAYSTNGGLAWNNGGSLPTSTTTWRVAFDGTSFMAINTTVAVVATATVAAATSATAWTNATALPAVASHVAGGNGIWVALVTGSTTYYTSTNNGSTWTTRTKSDSGAINLDCFTFANGRFMYVSANTAYMSTDGINWTTGATGWNQNWTGLAYGVDRWVATGNAGSGALGRSLYSLDNGQNWTAVTFPLDTSTAGVGLAYSPTGGFLSVGGTALAYTLYPFTANWTCPTGVLAIDCLLVGAGGGGGAGTSTANAGGGGGGQYIRKFLTVVPGTTYAVTIGSGGYGVSGSNGGYGANSTFGSLLTAIGGGGGGWTTTPGSPGASGGGGAGGGSTTSGGGGGGGAGGPGGVPSYAGTAITAAGNLGGLGTTGSSGGFGLGVNSISGSGGAGVAGFCGGGGGGASNATFMIGAGSSGGGRGGAGITGGAGTANTGGGGGGGGSGTATLGGQGGSGYCQITWWA